MDLVRLVVMYALMIFYKKLKFWRFDNVLRNVWPYFAAQAETISASGQKSNTFTVGFTDRSLIAESLTLHVRLLQIFVLKI